MWILLCNNIVVKVGEHDFSIRMLEVKLLGPGVVVVFGLEVLHPDENLSNDREEIGLVSLSFVSK